MRYDGIRIRKIRGNIRDYKRYTDSRRSKNNKSFSAVPKVDMSHRVKFPGII